MRLLVFGAKNLGYLDISPYIPKETTLIIRGNSNLVELCAEQYADEHGISKLVLRPNRQHGKWALYRRDQEMLRLCDAVLIVWDQKSFYIKKLAEKAQRLGKMLTMLVFAPQEEKKASEHSKMNDVIILREF